MLIHLEYQKAHKILTQINPSILVELNGQNYYEEQNNISFNDYYIIQIYSQPLLKPNHAEIPLLNIEEEMKIIVDELSKSKMTIKYKAIPARCTLLDEELGRVRVKILHFSGHW